MAVVRSRAAVASLAVPACGLAIACGGSPAPPNGAPARGSGAAASARTTSNWIHGDEPCPPLEPDGAAAQTAATTTAVTLSVVCAVSAAAISASAASATEPRPVSTASCGSSSTRVSPSEHSR